MGPPKNRIAIIPGGWAGAALVPLATLAILAVIDRAFLVLSDAPRHLAASERLSSLSGAAEGVLRGLVERDEVTWDPTNGTRMGAVLAHLRPGEGRPILMLGSSQLITLRDDRRLGAHAKRVDRELERLAPARTTVYNLSVGAMTAAEKALVLERALAVERFAEVLVCVTPWDSREESVRPELRAIDARPERRPRGEYLDADMAAGPPRVNRAVERALREALSSRVGFFARRSAIRAWLTGAASEDAPARAGMRDVRGARAVEYRWSREEERRIEANALDLVTRLGALSRAARFRGWIVVTPRRPDPRHPLYEPGFERRFESLLESACDQEGLGFLDASDLLGTAHFGVYELGELRGRIDGFHFDTAGHERLAHRIAQALWGSLVR